MITEYLNKLLIYLVQFAGWVILFIKAIGFPIAIIVVLYAALLYMTSGGHPERLKRAHKTLLWALVGIAVLLIGGGFVTIVCNTLTVECPSNFQNFIK